MSAQRTRQPLRQERLDVERVLAGEAFVIVSLPDGRWVTGPIVEREWMFVPTGEPVPISKWEEANRRRQQGRLRAELLTVMLTERGLRDPEIADELTRAGLLTAGDPDDPDDPGRLRSVRRWRVAGRKWLGTPVKPNLEFKVTADKS